MGKYIKTFENFDWDEDEEEDVFSYNNGVLHVIKENFYNFLSNIGYRVMSDIKTSKTSTYKTIYFKIDIDTDMPYRELRLVEVKLYNEFKALCPYFDHLLINQSNLYIVFNDVHSVVFE